MSILTLDLIIFILMLFGQDKIKINLLSLSSFSGVEGKYYIWILIININIAVNL